MAAAASGDCDARGWHTGSRRRHCVCGWFRRATTPRWPRRSPELGHATAPCEQNWVRRAGHASNALHAGPHGRRISRRVLPRGVGLTSCAASAAGVARGSALRRRTRPLVPSTARWRTAVLTATAFSMRRASPRPSSAGDHRSCWRPSADGERRWLLPHHLQRRNLQPQGHQTAAGGQGPPVPHIVRHRGDPACVRGVWPGVRGEARRDVRVRHLRRPAAGAVRGARSAGEEAVLLHRPR